MPKLVTKTARVLGAVALAAAVLLGASACVPDEPISLLEPSLKPLPKDSAAPTPTKRAQANSVEPPEILPEPSCGISFTCPANDVWRGVVDSAPEYRVALEDKRIMYTATLLTLVGPGNPNDAGNGYTSRRSMIQLINTAESGSQFSCFHFQMRNWVSENARNEAYMKSASFAFENGLPKLAGLVMTKKIDVNAITKDSYGSSKGEGFNTEQIKKIAETPLKAAGMSVPDPRSAIDTWAKVYAKSADLGLQISYEESLTDLSGKMMACQANG